ncbi:hypothetical protein SETIT_1G048200v2 [Setaria italica]|uniref:Uncharacterized protein n=1 Tax=Setaria italica TaxID=4555 RepID=A0A368PGX4_SETIT|nr:hypothetical protein SETIT_1G048200v2 [Setaria italica]
MARARLSTRDITTSAPRLGSWLMDDTCGGRIISADSDDVDADVASTKVNEGGVVAIVVVGAVVPGGASGSTVWSCIGADAAKVAVGGDATRVDVTARIKDDDNRAGAMAHSRGGVGGVTAAVGGGDAAAGPRIVDVRAGVAGGATGIALPVGDAGGDAKTESILASISAMVEDAVTVGTTAIAADVGGDGVQAHGTVTIHTWFPWMLLARMLAERMPSRSQLQRRSCRQQFESPLW